MHPPPELRFRACFHSIRLPCALFKSVLTQFPTLVVSRYLYSISSIRLVFPGVCVSSFTQHKVLRVFHITACISCMLFFIVIFCYMNTPQYITLPVVGYFGFCPVYDYYELGYQHSCIHLQMVSGYLWEQYYITIQIHSISKAFLCPKIFDIIYLSR